MAYHTEETPVETRLWMPEHAVEEQGCPTRPFRTLQCEVCHNLTLTLLPANWSDPDPDLLCVVTLLDEEPTFKEDSNASTIARNDLRVRSGSESPPELGELLSTPP